jgi:cytochrome c oxidase subunit 1
VTTAAEGTSNFQTTTTRPRETTMGQQIVKVLTTTDHKIIGKLYLATSFAWFIIGGLMAMVIRSELAFPGQQVVNDELYNQLFTMHGTIMLLLFATPLFFGFGVPDPARCRRLRLDRLHAAVRRRAQPGRRR